jgi:hypothetical protein
MHTPDSDRSLRAIARRSRQLAAAFLVIAGLGAAGCTESIPPVALASLRILPQVDSFTSADDGLEPVRRDPV